MEAVGSPCYGEAVENMFINRTFIKAILLLSYLSQFLSTCTVHFLDILMTNQLIVNVITRLLIMKMVGMHDTYFFSADTITDNYLLLTADTNNINDNFTFLRFRC